MTDAPLTMPRRLAIQLLHEAQIAERELHALVTASGGEGAEPDARLALANGAALAAAISTIDGAGRRAWAHYLFRPDCLPPPLPSDFNPEPSLLRLTASLETKGVLKLRAWALVGGDVVERALRIRD